jgi:hypothetical protein
MTTSMRWTFVGLGLLVLGALAGAFGPRALVRWRAERTARTYVHALRTQDSVTLARLSARASAHNSLCASRHWPETYWTRAGRDAPVRLRFVWKDTAYYRAFGKPWRADTFAGRFDFQIALARPTKVARYTLAPLPRPASEAFRACIGE